MGCHPILCDFFMIIHQPGYSALRLDWAINSMHGYAKMRCLCEMDPSLG